MPDPAWRVSGATSPWTWAEAMAMAHAMRAFDKDPDARFKVVGYRTGVVWRPWAYSVSKVQLPIGEHHERAS